MPRIATNDRVERDQLLDFVRTRHHLVLMTTKADGRPQISPVTGGVDADGRIVISTYPDRAKAVNLRRNPATSVLDRHCKAHELDNLYVVDASFFPSSGAVNPALTIVANALRVADHLKSRMGVRDAALAEA